MQRIASSSTVRVAIFGRSAVVNLLALDERLLLPETPAEDSVRPEEALSEAAELGPQAGRGSGVDGRSAAREVSS